jgi:hypothetical protein
MYSPKLIILETATDRFDMFNSVQILKRSYVTESNEMMDEFKLITSMNSGVVMVINKLNSHDIKPLRQVESLPHWPGIHEQEHKSIVSGFGAPVNDSKVSPDGLYMASVGDHGCVWVTPIRYSSESAPMDTELNQSEIYSSTDSELPHQVFVKPTRISLENIFPPEPLNGEPTMTAPPLFRRDDSSFQYLAWTNDSKAFAVSSDKAPWILIFGIYNEGVFKLVARINAGGNIIPMPGIFIHG